MSTGWQGWQDPMGDTGRELAEEARRADTRYGPFTSTHEALGVLTEEVDELRDAIRANDLEAVAREALQVAAVAIRLRASLAVEATRKRSVP